MLHDVDTAFVLEYLNRLRTGQVVLEHRNDFETVLSSTDGTLVYQVSDSLLSGDIEECFCASGTLTFCNIWHTHSPPLPIRLTYYFYNRKTMGNLKQNLFFTLLLQLHLRMQQTKVLIPLH